jgi:outer membrane protein OmpA-like peptidoglycan-associated protein
MAMTGLDVAPGYMDLGTTNWPHAGPADDLPLFRLTRPVTARPHPYLGRVIHTHDPGRAPFTGRCREIGAITMQQLRGLAPFTVREFRIDFDFCSDVLTDQMQRRVIEILTCAATAQATAIAVKGYSAITLLSNGQRLEEPEGLAGQRARKIADVFVDLGAARERLRVEWADSHVQPDGKGDAARRRVMVTVVP